MEKYLHSEYLSVDLNSKYDKVTLSEVYKAIVGQVNINAQELQEIRICIPPVNLQNAYATFVNEFESKKDYEKRTC
ncbi:MAG TPA: hypothetical protein O0Y06_04365 [Methanocorpusculum sp.]|nr:hypothetical protein [Methanocorpusculum sp.]HJK80116.1 hypothetical protein [Methanocorpusculum sp.]